MERFPIQEDDFSLSYMSPAHFYELYKGYNFYPEGVVGYFPHGWDLLQIEQAMIAEVNRRNEEYSNQLYEEFTKRNNIRMKRRQEEYVDKGDELTLTPKNQLARKVLEFMSRPEIIENGYSYDQDEYDDLVASFGELGLCENKEGEE